jgi:hypothetical protein
MNKLIAFLLICSATFGTATAQFRALPAPVTDAFRKQYPNATQAAWSDKLSYWQVIFDLDSNKYLARYDNKGVWKGSEQTITGDRLPAPVKDGYDKSKYTDEWQIKEYTALYLPGNIIKYRLLVRKSGVQKKYLYFNASGKLLQDNSTL